jgi:hypothetical protein
VKEAVRKTSRNTYWQDGRDVSMFNTCGYNKEHFYYQALNKTRNENQNEE